LANSTFISLRYGCRVLEVSLLSSSFVTASLSGRLSLDCRREQYCGAIRLCSSGMYKNLAWNQETKSLVFVLTLHPFSWEYQTECLYPCKTHIMPLRDSTHGTVGFYAKYFEVHSCICSRRRKSECAW